MLSLCLVFALVSCEKDEPSAQLIPPVQNEQQGSQEKQGIQNQDEHGEATSDGQTGKTHIKIGIIGDSISTYDGYLPSSIDGYDGASYKSYYPKGNVNKVEKTWWFKSSALLGSDIDDICNCSWSGSYVTGNAISEDNAAAGCSNRRIQDLSARGFTPDIILCYISCNDWANNIPMGTWVASDVIPETTKLETMREAYAVMLLKIRQAYPSSTVFCMTNLEDTKRDATPGWPSNNKKGISTEAWNKGISELAEQLDCYTIDLQTCGINYDNLGKYTVDGGLHPNDAGMTLIAKKVAQSVSEVLRDKI